MRVKPWEDLDLETHWGWLDVRDKVVLDVGADYGSTADFFLSQGAAAVIAVESDPRLFRRLKALAEQRANLKAVQKRVASVADWRDLLTTYSAQVVKVDCEGGEGFLLDLEDHLFGKPEAWAVELHTREQAKRWGNAYPWGGVDTLWLRFLEKLTDCGYAIAKDVPHWVGRVVCGVRGDLLHLSRPGDSESKTRVAIVGTQRPGTRLLEEYLASHPNVECGGEVLNPTPGWPTRALADFFEGGEAEFRVCCLTYDQVSDVTAVWLQMNEVLIIHLICDDQREQGQPCGIPATDQDSPRRIVSIPQGQIERWRRLFQAGPYLEVNYEEIMGCEGAEVPNLPQELECKLWHFLDLDPAPFLKA